jgi:outer membrane protein TolC
VPDVAGRALADALPAFAPPPPLAAMSEGLEHHPQHAMAVRAQNVAEADVALAREASKPDRSIEVGYYARSADRSDMLMFQVAFELPIFAATKQDRLLAAKLAQLERSRELRADHLRQLRAELAGAYADWDLAGERLRNVTTSILPDAKARLDALVAQHGAGGAPLAAVLEGRRGLTEAELQALTLRAAQAKARVVLEYFEHQGESR